MALPGLDIGGKGIRGRQSASATAAAIAALAASAAAAASETQKDFIASGAISDKAKVALRSDGKVEVVTGTETLAAIGADVSITAATKFVILDAVYSATSGNLAVIYFDDGATNTVYAVIGTISGGTITFGTPVSVGADSTYANSAKAAWNAAGTTLVVAFRGATAYANIIAGTVSGTVITFGTAVANANDSGLMTALFHDDTHGARVVLLTATGYLIAATYTGTVVTVGTRAALSMRVTNNATAVFYHYDGANTRFFMTGYSASNGNSQVATLSGTTWTVGSVLSSSGIKFSAGCFDSSGTKYVLLGYIGSGQNPGFYAYVVTISGTVPTLNAGVFLTGIGDVNAVNNKAAYDAASGKVLIAVNPNSGGALSDNAAHDGGIAAFVGTISGTSTSWSDAALIESGSLALVDLLVGATSKIAFVFADYDNFGRHTVTTAKIISGLLTRLESFIMRSLPPYGSVTQALLPGSWTMVSVGSWTGTVTAGTAFAVTLPDESTNADAWIGQARNAAVDGATVTVRFGGIIDGQSGLTPGSAYYLKGDATLTAVDNGRRAGVALSATEFLKAA